MRTAWIILQGSRTAGIQAETSFGANVLLFQWLSTCMRGIEGYTVYIPHICTTPYTPLGRHTHLKITVVKGSGLSKFSRKTRATQSSSTSSSQLHTAPGICSPGSQAGFRSLPGTRLDHSPDQAVYTRTPRARVETLHPWPLRSYMNRHLP